MSTYTSCTYHIWLRPSPCAWSFPWHSQRWTLFPTLFRPPSLSRQNAGVRRRQTCPRTDTRPDLGPPDVVAVQPRAAVALPAEVARRARPCALFEVDCLAAASEEPAARKLASERAQVRPVEFERRRREPAVVGDVPLVVCRGDVLAGVGLGERNVLTLSAGCPPWGSRRRHSVSSWR